MHRLPSLEGTDRLGTAEKSSPLGPDTLSPEATQNIEVVAGFKASPAKWQPAIWHSAGIEVIFTGSVNESIVGAEQWGRATELIELGHRGSPKSVAF